jgi:signal transduction histidine kinase
MVIDSRFWYQLHPQKVGDDMAPYSIPPQPATGQKTARNSHVALTPPPSDSDTEDTSRWVVEQAFEHVPFGVVIVDSTTRHIKIANRFARELYHRSTGLPADSLSGKQVDDLLPWIESHGVLDQLGRVSETGAPVLSQIMDLALDSEEPFGTLWEYDIVPLPSREGNAHDLLLTFRDVTPVLHERKRAEAATFAALQRTELLESIFEQIAEAVVVRDRDGKLIVYNREALTLARNQTAVERGRAHGERVNPDWDIVDSAAESIPQPDLPIWKAMFSGETMLTNQLLVRKEDGTLTPLLIHATPLRDEVGAIIGAVAAFQDISVVKEEERLKDEMTTAASHELRQPITVIQGQAQRLKRQLRQLTEQEHVNISPAFLRKLADGMESQTARLNRLVSDLLDMSRIQSGHLQLHCEPMSLTRLMDRLVELQQEASIDHQFVIEDKAPPHDHDGGLVGMWDESRIEQILANLLQNAVKYSPTGGQIRVTLGVLPRGTRVGSRARGRKRLGSDSAHVAITDEGIGIPAAAMPHLFERFYRASNSSDIQGTGLGLYICQQLAAAHHGYLWAESRGLGHGSTFHLALPLPVSPQ